MDLTYITERIIAMTYPPEGSEDGYRSNLREVTKMLKTKHGENYTVFNLSERRYDLAGLNHQILDFGWPENLAPPLERLCSICKAIDTWLNSNPHHIVVLHSKGSKERAGVVVAAYTHYSNICASADQALDRFAMKKFCNEKCDDLPNPSQKRYINYFSGLLSGAIKINSSPLYLNQILIYGAPNFDGKGGCKLFVKVYQGLQPSFTSGVYSVSSSTRCLTITLDTPLQLRGDILIKAYHRRVKPDSREVVFCSQFHTCAVSGYSLTFPKDDLDSACNDSRFPISGRVELKFSSAPERHYTGIKDMSVPVDYSPDALVRCDSYENFDTAPEDSPQDIMDIDSGHDGSLYATVNKKKLPPSQINGCLHHHPHPREEYSNVPNGLHAASIDSGISSASGRHHHAFPSVSSSTPPQSSGPSTGTTVTSEGFTPTNLFDSHSDSHQQSRSTLPSEEQRKLDELLNSMLADIESIPDLKTTSMLTSPTSTTTTTISRNVIYNVSSQPSYGTTKPGLSNGYSHSSEKSPVGHHYINGSHHDEDEQDMPYHARKDSRPFTYGAVTPPSPQMLRKHVAQQQGANPSSVPPLVSASGRSVSTPVHSSISAPPTPSFDSNHTYQSPTSGSLPKPYQGTMVAPVLEERFIEIQSRDMSPDGVRSDCDEPYSWLQRQQQKLRDRREARVRGERYPREQQLIWELRTAQTRLPYSSGGSRDEIDALQPLHIHTGNGHSSYNGYSSVPGKPPPVGRGGSSAPSSPLIPSRGISREVTRSRMASGGSSTPQTLPWSTPSKSLHRQRSDTSHDRERPFVTVRRVYEQQRKQAEQTGAHPLLSSSPQYQSSIAYSAISPTSHRSPGLLTTVDGKPGEPRTSSPVSSHLDDLEMSIRAVSVQPSSSGRALSPIERSRSPPDLNAPSYGWSGDGSHSPRSYSPSTPLPGDRPITPAFPVHPRTPYSNQESTPPPQYVTGLPPKSPTLSRKDRSPSPGTMQQLRSGLSGVSGLYTSNGQSSPTVYFGQSQRSSMVSLTEPLEVIHHHPIFVKDLSKYWYKPNISREEAISMLKDKQPGTFVVRDSNSFPGAFGLALKVATPPPNVQNKTGDLSNELVRHFLIEPTTKGVKLKGCSNEPIFGSLSALVYQHSITPLALPCKLLLPESDPSPDEILESLSTSNPAQMLIQGAACNVSYLFTAEMESLTGPQAIRKASSALLNLRPLPTPTVVHFKVSAQGITLTDSNRKLFFRRHYPVVSISHCGLDPEERCWTQRNEDGIPVSQNRIFGFVARKPASKTDNQCHLFAELEPEQPAAAIVNFVTKVMMSSSANSRAAII